jgi:hypothetical protein
MVRRLGRLFEWQTAYLTDGLLVVVIIFFLARVIRSTSGPICFAKRFSGLRIKFLVLLAADFNI